MDTNEGELASYLSRVVLIKPIMDNHREGSISKPSADIFQPRLPGLCNELRLFSCLIAGCACIPPRTGGHIEIGIRK